MKNKTILISLCMGVLSLTACKKDKDTNITDTPARRIVESENLEIPVAVDLPANSPGGNTRVATYFARGVQKYKAQVKAGSFPVTYEWVFVAPQADLYDASNKKVGTHSAGPTWQLSATDSIYGQHFTPAKTSPATDAEQFDKIIGGKINYLEIYNASEGFVAAQVSPDDDGMLLFTEHGIFYEFMPVEEYGSKNPLTVGLKDVVIGKNYALVISTTGGLWRYLIGDTIQFTSLNPYKIKISGRLKHYMNAFGEEVIVDNSDKAIAFAAEKTNAVVNDYTAAPVYFSDNSNGAHEWLIEFEKEPDDMDVFTAELDKALKNINSDYEAKRHKNIALRMPLIHSLAKGTFRQWLRNKGKLGGQHKVPRLSNERVILEEIINLQNNG